MRARIPIVVACAALFAVACQDSPTDPVEQPVATAPEFNFLNGPAQPGQSNIERYATNGVFHWTADFQTPWLLVTYDPFKTLGPDCADFNPPNWEMQVKERVTKDGLLTTQLMQAEREVTLLDHFLWDTEYPHFCPFLQADWKYMGTAKFVVHRTYLDGNFVSFSGSANGFVEDQSGNTYRFHWQERADADGNERISIEVTPIGS